VNGSNCGCIASEHRGADGSGVKTKLSGDDLRRFEAWLKGPTFNFLNDGIENQRTGIHNSAAKYDPLDIQQIDDARDARPDIFSRSLDHHQREVVTFVRLVSDVFRGKRFV
jgi:hypothetical protein